jgi:hypothetical protein
MRLTETLPGDIPQIQDWIDADPFHKDDPDFYAEGLLTGCGALAFCVVDDDGPLCFVLLTPEGDRLRLATQFAPEEQVSKRRLISGLLSTGIPAILIFAKDKGYKGVVFESVNASLINFMDKNGFKPAGGDDYALIFEGKDV